MAVNTWPRDRYTGSGGGLYTGSGGGAYGTDSGLCRAPHDPESRVCCFASSDRRIGRKLEDFSGRTNVIELENFRDIVKAELT
jgi:hypothetical protein